MLKKVGKMHKPVAEINTWYNETQLHRSGMILKEFAQKKYKKVNVLCAKDQPAFKMASVHYCKASLCFESNQGLEEKYQML